MGGDEGNSKPHDGFFKGLVAQPGVAEALIRERLPPEVVAMLGTRKPEVLPGTFVDEVLRGSQADQLVRVRTANGSPAYVYCLMEHKSCPDGRVAEQLLRYLARIWSAIGRDKPRPRFLPPVVPLVIYHGARPWPGPRRFSERLNVGPDVRRLVLDFPYFVFDMGRVPEDELSGNQALKAGLITMKYATRPRVQVQVLEAVMVENRYLTRPAFELGMVYILSAYKQVDAATFWNTMRNVMPERVSEFEGSLALRQWRAEWQAEGEAKGEAKGKAEGEAKGKAEGEARALLKIFARRGLQVTDTQRAQILATTDLPTLDRWIDRALDATVAADVFE